MSGNKRALDSPSPSSASCSNSRWKYDVFLSFRGETRNNFTDHLYKALKQNGIYTFRDKERLERGKEIASELLKAIESSRFSIVILSKNYASSTWCLEELAKIVECHKDTEKSNIFPVFYWVEPSEVRHQLGDFKTAFDKHEQVFGDNLKKVERWRSALTQVANLSGFTVSTDRPESRLIEEIVRVISIKLNGPFPNISKGFVGIESRLKNIFQLLEPESNDIRFLGICGMGGIGKTTIAEIVLNNLQHSYEGSCFLANVREVCGEDGAVALQQKLLSAVLKDTDPTISNVLQGRMLIQSRLCRKKVLVVLDDVSNCHEQLDNLAGDRDWFGPGSRIVITTRDEHVLISRHKIIDEIYKVEALEDYEALELFCLKAFGQFPSPPDYLQLSEDIVHHTQGLPLALNILGSHLSGKTVDQWKSALKSFEDYPNVGIMKVLRISYDKLPPNEKDIFLDIACFFKSEDEDQVKKILTSRGFHPDDGIENLIRKSLVTISGNIVSMHDLLQEMGWEIVREQHRKEPGKWTRLWRPDDVHHVLTDNTGTGNVEGIVVDMPKKGTSTCLNAKSFMGMKNLMLLKISNVDLFEDLEYLPNRLQYLEWHGCPLKNLPPNFQAQKLVELNLCYSQINYLWTGRKAFKELKTIKLNHSCNLIETPDFTEVPNLEMLDLEGCRILCKVHESVGSLKLLMELNLKNCENLESFPSNVDGMKALEILNLQGCSKLEKLPENLGELASLKELDAGRTAIIQVPPSIVRLTKLKMLSFRGHRVRHNQWRTFVAVIAGFSSFWSRRNRNFMGLSLPSLAGLFNLTKLDLSDCNLTDGALSNDLGSLCSLTVLNLSNNYFVSLPESINQLSKLKKLCVQNCQNLKSLPELPSKLSFVRAEDCPLLEDLSSMLRGGTSPNFTLCLFNCFKLLENHGQQNNLAVMLLKQYLQQPVNYTSLFDIPLLGSEIPEWFSCRSDGDSVVIGLPGNWLNDEFMGIAMCGVFAPDPDVDLNDVEDSDDGVDSNADVASFQMSLISNKYEFGFIIPEGFRTVKSDILWLTYVSRLRFEHDYSIKLPWDDTSSDDDSSDYIASEIAPEITCPKKEIAPVSGSTCIHARLKPKSNVIKCGIRLVYKQDLEDFQELPTAEGSTFHQHHKCSLRGKHVGRHTSKLLSLRSVTNPFQGSGRYFLGNILESDGDYWDHLPGLDGDYLNIIIADTQQSVFFRSNKHEIIFNDDYDSD